MNTRLTASLIFLGSIIGGCASYNSDDAVLSEALQEKEAAYMRVAKAITSYCSVSTDTLDSRQSCILERRLSLLQYEQSSRSPLRTAY